MQHRGLINLPGGYQLLLTGLTLNSVIPAGTPVLVDDVARTAKVIKTAKIFANALNSDVTYQVAKGSPFIVGDFITKAGAVQSRAITAIDTTTNTDHDVLTVATTLGYALTAGDSIVAAAAVNASAVVDVASGLLYNDSKVFAGKTVTVSVAGQFYVNRIPPLTAAQIASLKGIILLNSK